MSTLEINKSNQAQDVSFIDAMMKISFEDGRELSIPLEWFPKLREATRPQLQNWRFIGDGEGIHWSELDEDISVAQLLR